MVRPPQEFRTLAQSYVCVRVTNINRVDLNVFPFDHDLTLAIVLANADGTVYHRYGGRDSRSQMHMETLLGLMKAGLETHREYSRGPAPPRPMPPMRLKELVEERLKGRIHPVFGCYHCHYAREARQTLAMEAGQWTPDQFWIFPETTRVGLVMDQRQQVRVAQVLDGSPADTAGLRKGDVLERLDGRGVRTKYDIQWILHERDDGAGRLPFVARRGGREIEGALELGAQWKVGDPEDYAWRVRNVYTRHMTKFLPAPGFVGERLAGAAMEEAGLEGKRFALRIEQLNYGTHLAGIRVGDVILSAAGRADFATARDFHAWCESLRQAGRDIRMQLVRQGEELSVMVPLASLNYSKVEKAPQAELGFIVQQLSGQRGLRVGHVTDGCSAERAGVRIGDRLVKAGGTEVTSREAVLGLLNDMAPGDLLTIEVRRGGEPLQLAFVLSGEAERRSDVARLEGAVTESGQELDCVVTIRVPPGKHIYSMHREGFGVPTHFEFRGRGYELLGPAEEPPPRRIPPESGRAEAVPMWVLEGDVECRQRLRVTDAGKFQLLVQVYAQVCDEEGCHEFRAVLSSDGSDGKFHEYLGRFERQPKVGTGEVKR